MIFALLFRLTRYWTGPSAPEGPCTDLSGLSGSAKRHLRSVA